MAVYMLSVWGAAGRQACVKSVEEVGGENNLVAKLVLKCCLCFMCCRACSERR